MKAKEKAKELVDKMYQYQWRKDTIEFRNAKQCALIAVDELIKETGSKYWYDVKQEIEDI